MVKFNWSQRAEHKDMRNSSKEEVQQGVDFETVTVPAEVQKRSITELYDTYCMF
jgi:hypothetical protein